MRSITIGMLAFVFAFAFAVPRSACAADKDATLGKVSGTCTFEKSATVKFIDGVALSGHSFFHDDQPAMLVRVSTFTLGAFRPDLRVDPEAGLDDLSNPKDHYNMITIIIDMNGELEGLGPSGSLRSGFTFTGGHVTNGRISGTIGGTGGARGEDGCQISFDVPVVGDYGSGKSLPADGGEAGNVMRALWKSLKDEDSAATIATLGESLVPAAQHGTMPQFVALFGSGGGNSVVGGKLYGAARAIIDLDLGSGLTARALVLKQGDRWRVQDVSFE